ncbi:putative silencing suppressor [Tomato necrotic streak virus]|uniref:Putative silencing suppressor n=1 Tax=Tomato necrotic streak virus TaxID=1637492 RepID=A0A140GPI7_9BROM|nr:putative silencing suppressor [Tomato necrotic streak virus]AMN16530.1 putative silencing suppressor [Tomato necrotic streak virus]
MDMSRKSNVSMDAVTRELFKKELRYRLKMAEEFKKQARDPIVDSVHTHSGNRVDAGYHISPKFFKPLTKWGVVPVLSLVNLSAVSEARWMLVDSHQLAPPLVTPRVVSSEMAPEPEARMLIKIPDLGIDYELREFTNPAVVIQSIYRRIIGEVPKGWYGLKSWSISSYGDVYSRLRVVRKMKVHLTIPGSDWAYTLSLSDVISGLAIPRLPIPEKYLKMPISISFRDEM